MIETYFEDRPLKLKAINITSYEKMVLVQMTVGNKAGKLTTRKSNQANSNFLNGVYLIDGNVNDVNEILSDLIFVPALHFGENINISVKI